jgi:hypothetical protein
MLQIETFATRSLCFDHVVVRVVVIALSDGSSDHADASGAELSDRSGETDGVLDISMG